MQGGACLFRVPAAAPAATPAYLLACFSYLLRNPLVYTNLYWSCSAHCTKYEQVRQQQ
jgi:hypothetical protein